MCRFGILLLAKIPQLHSTRINGIPLHNPDREPGLSPNNGSPLALKSTKPHTGSPINLFSPIYFLPLLYFASLSTQDLAKLRHRLNDLGLFLFLSLQVFSAGYFLWSLFFFIYVNPFDVSFSFLVKCKVPQDTSSCVSSFGIPFHC